MFLNAVFFYNFFPLCNPWQLNHGGVCRVPAPAAADDEAAAGKCDARAVRTDATRREARDVNTTPFVGSADANNHAGSAGACILAL